MKKLFFRYKCLYFRLADLTIRFWECCYLNMDSSSVMYPVILSMIVMLVRCQEDSVNEIVRVSGLLGGTVKLPCDTSPPSPINPLLLTIWFKDQLQDPIYRCRYIQCQLLLVAPDMQGSKFKITTTHTVCIKNIILIGQTVFILMFTE